ncbi:MAG TPA: protein kinase [Vicinamibacterales bacterium]|nr:protein kinase [Vicinamibacterales bacterium]
MFEPGTQLGRYEIQRRLGRGGMGTVYVAHDPVLGRMVAIKVFAGDLDVPDARERFSREARAAAALNHPNIVTVYDFGEYGSQPYIVMEYVPGETMANLIRRKMPVSIGDKLRWMQELCAGAGYAHQMSVIHRDIKPANLVIDRSGRLKILDFGIARMLGIASNTSVMIGTPGYMAPEQITGDPVDHRSDQFSIGVVFYELLAYAEPFPGDTLPAITHRILNEQPKALLGLAPDVTPEIVAIVEQALKKNINERFNDTETLRLAIVRVRRQFESDDSWSGASTPMNRDITPPGGMNRGTGSERRRTGGGVGVAQMTPPPDPRRTDREAIARRRSQQVEAALAEARRLLAAQQLEAALDACQQALTLDENHVGAIELERRLAAALRVRRGVDMPAEDPDLTIASEPMGQDPRLMESQAVTRMHEDGLAVTGPTMPIELPGAPPLGVGERTVLRPVNPVGARERDPSYAARQQDPSLGDAEPTIVAPARRTPAPRVARPAAIPPAEAPVAKTPAAPAPTKAKSAKVPVQKAPPGPDFMTRMKSIAAPAAEAVSKSLRSLTPPAMPKQKAIVLWASVGAVLLLAIAATTYFLTRGPVPTGTLVIDAAPWATVTAIQNDSGTAQTLPSPASTPLLLVLPAGNYQVTLTGPNSKVATINVRVDVGGVAVAPMARFQTVTVEEYFEQYLGSGLAGLPAPESPAAPASAQSAPPPTSTGGNK